jgi:PPP family 3-phenylpropionic acid transporter
LKSDNSSRKIAGIHFLNFAARGLALPFVNLYLVSVGFTGTEIGVVMSISALVQLLLTPTLHTLADRNRRHRLLFYGLVFGTSISSWGLISSINRLWLSGMVVLRESADKPGVSLLSQLTISWLETHGQDIYGRLRAWGSLGWAVTTMISGRIFAAGGYPLLFILSGLLNLATLPFLNTLPEHTTGQSEPRHPTGKRSSGFNLLLLSLFLYFVGMSGFMAFIFVYLQQDLGANTEMIGMAAAVAALAEIPPMILIDVLLRRFSVRTTMILGTLGMAASWLSFAIITSAVYIIPLMILRGTVYTLHTVSMPLLVSRISHPSNAATNQAIAQVTVPGLAILLTGPISGWIFDQAGGRVLFTISMLMAVLSASILLAGRRQLRAADTPLIANPASDPVNQP